MMPEQLRVTKWHGPLASIAIEIPVSASEARGVVSD